ncbi:hypothetical protein CC78DRAFT_361237 [Lojkania enalia]|uniref:Uncharacterized protein n=1 Tax=Lojkania enalia TaxID=147567 RepID=A0A9P4K487_9PLEO|nr:hypothetical protein CC78DRAFT_361237 [Didymosphaeria enalia]
MRLKSYLDRILGPSNPTIYNPTPPVPPSPPFPAPPYFPTPPIPPSPSNAKFTRALGFRFPTRFAKRQKDRLSHARQISSPVFRSPRQCFRTPVLLVNSTPSTCIQDSPIFPLLPLRLDDREGPDCYHCCQCGNITSKVESMVECRGCRHDFCMPGCTEIKGIARNGTSGFHPMVATRDGSWYWTE